MSLGGIQKLLLLCHCLAERQQLTVGITFFGFSRVVRVVVTELDFLRLVQRSRVGHPFIPLSYIPLSYIPLSYSRRHA